VIEAAAGAAKGGGAAGAAMGERAEPYTAEEIAYRARALAQTHPLSPLAKKFVDRVVGEQRLAQPSPEVGIWAGAAVLNGYCLRRVEEAIAGVAFDPETDYQPAIEHLDEAARLIATDLRGDDAAQHLLGDVDRTVEGLDRIIASEVSKRLDHWSEDLDAEARAELEEYLTWWVLKGYAVRVAETPAETKG